VPACNASYPSSTLSVALASGVTMYAGVTARLSQLVSHPFVAAEGLPPRNMSANAAIFVPPVAGLPDNVSLTLRYAVLPPQAGPGQLRSAEPGGVSNSTMLQSLFMAYIDVVDEHGNFVPAAAPNISLANTSFSTPVSDDGADPLTWWWFNATLGLWVPAQSLSGGGGGGRRLEALDPATVEAQAAGYWNSDRNVRTACTVIQVRGAGAADILGNASALSNGCAPLGSAPPIAPVLWGCYALRPCVPSAAGGASDGRLALQRRDDHRAGRRRHRDDSRRRPAR
jgi:hypothetical protein